MPLYTKELAIPSSALAAELLGIELLEEHARRLAAGLTVDMRRARRPRKHLRRLVEHSDALRQIYTSLAEDVRAGEPPSLIEEIWRAVLTAMLILLVGEAALCLPKRAARPAGAWA